MERLIDFLLSIWQTLVPFVRLEPWEAGVRTSAFPFLKPRYSKVGPGGIVWKCPFFQEVSFTNILRQPVFAPRQTVRTRDGRELTFAFLIIYSIKRPDDIWTKVQDFDDAIVGVVMKEGAKYVGMHDLADCTFEELANAAFRAARAEGFKWGCEIEEVCLTELTTVFPFRLLGDYIQTRTV